MAANFGKLPNVRTPAQPPRRSRDNGRRSLGSPRSSRAATRRARKGHPSALCSNAASLVCPAAACQPFRPLRLVAPPVPRRNRSAALRPERLFHLGALALVPLDRQGHQKRLRRRRSALEFRLRNTEIKSARSKKTLAIWSDSPRCPENR